MVQGAIKKSSQFSIIRRNAGREVRALGKEIYKCRLSYFFLAPFAVVFFTFTVIPVITAVCLSFTDYNIVQAPDWVGWDNYIKLLFNDDIFLTAIKNTLIFAVVTGPVGYLSSFFMAWLINEQGRLMRVILTFILYAPSLSGQIYIIWQVFFSGDAYGYANGFLMNLGWVDAPIQWLTDPAYMMPVVILVMLWMSLGTSFLVFIAGFQALSRSYYEAAMVDGIRNRWQELWYITLPLMKPQLMFGAVMAITNAFSVFDQVSALVGFPSTDYAAHTIVAHLADYGNIRYEMGYASAIAALLFLIMIGCNKAVQKLLHKVGS